MTESQLTLFENDVIPSTQTDLTTTFADNMKLPIHRWFRYSAGFSAEWVRKTIQANYKDSLKVIDPFSGSGTTLLSSNQEDVESVGYEKQPFIKRISESKLSYDVDVKELLKLSNDVINHKININYNYSECPDLLRKCFSEEVLHDLYQLKHYYLNNCKDNNIWNLIWLAISSIIRITSHAGTAQWQYVLPNKKKKNPLSVYNAFQKKIFEMIEDIKYFQNNNTINRAKVLDFDARSINHDYIDYFDLLITSPPYPNNYDYADATRLEMVFWGEIIGWSDLQNKVRNKLIRSCSQHTAAERLKLDDLLNSNELKPIRDEITQVCRQLEVVRENHGGKKTYHTMIAAYYLDLAQVFISLRKSMKNNSLMCFVIGDSAPYGVYAPADEWLGKLALSAGFSGWTFEKTRDRNIKWKNRKHTVPLKEGRLWIRG